ncbi:MAG: hypothetical protein PHF37_11200, partial [Phycisphaerae bacterium]|nr:hypothetical protein [Phycisphaerae bacterium]
ILRESRNYIKSPVQWGPFAEYIDEIKNMFYIINSQRFNSRFREKLLNSFNESELLSLFGVLDNLAIGRLTNRQSILTKDEIVLLKRAQKNLGDIEISIYKKSWRIDSFPIPKGDNQG